MLNVDPSSQDTHHHHSVNINSDEIENNFYHVFPFHQTDHHHHHHRHHHHHHQHQLLNTQQYHLDPFQCTDVLDKKHSNTATVQGYHHLPSGNTLSTLWDKLRMDNTASAAHRFDVDHNTTTATDNHYITPDTILQQRVQQPTKLPLIFFISAGLVQIAEACNILVLFSFSVYMVRSFGFSEQLVAIYAGFLGSIYPFAQFLTSFFWGWLSDYCGRKLCLLIGLAATCILALQLGLSTNIRHALGCRFVGGLLNGIVGVMKALIGDVTDSTNQAQAFSMFGIAWGIGSIIAPIAGSLLSSPSQYSFLVNTFPQLFAQGALFYRFPYLLPCVFSSLTAFVAFVVVLVFLHVPDNTTDSNNDNTDHASHPYRAIPSCAASSSPPPGRAPVEKIVKVSTDLQQHDHSVNQMRHRDIIHADTDYEYKINGSVNVNHQTQSLPSHHHQDKQMHQHQVNGDLLYDMHQLSADKIHQIHTSHQDHQLSTATHDQITDVATHSTLHDMHQNHDMSSQHPAPFRLNSKKVWGPMVGYTAICFASMIVEEAFPIYISTQPSLGGLGFTIEQFGKVLTLGGAILFLYQFFLFPVYCKFHGPVRAYLNAMFFCSLVYPFIPVSSLFVDKSATITWILVLLAQAFKIFAQSTAFTAIMILIANSTSKSHCGKVNGIAQMLGSLARTIGPELGGLIWSLTLQYKIIPFHQGAVFLLCGAITFYFYAFLQDMPETLNEPCRVHDLTDEDLASRSQQQQQQQQQQSDMELVEF